MKNVITIILLSVLLFSCQKDAENMVRIKNENAISANVNIGSVSFGRVSSGTTTDYKLVPEGLQTFSGEITGSYTFPEKGQHKWTLRIGTDGLVYIAEE